MTERRRPLSLYRVLITERKRTSDIWYANLDDARTAVAAVQEARPLTVMRLEVVDVPASRTALVDFLNRYDDTKPLTPEPRKERDK